MHMEVPGIGQLRVIHPIDVLDSRIQNLHLLPGKRTPAGIAQARLAVDVARGFIRSEIETRGERTALKLLERVAEIAADITPEVTRGKDVWHKNNCVNCHTLFGEGAYYAPDLTKIAKLRGAPYLTAYMRDPSQFYDEQVHRRLMPRQDLSEEEIGDLIVFLDWVSEVDNQGWPPRPIYVTGGLQREGAPAVGQAAAGDEARPVTKGDDPRALGENLFRTVAPACNACHSMQPGANMAGPSLAGVATRAEALIASGGYTGEAEDATGYIRESIVAPSAHLVPGAMYSA
ncbi:MAG: c-type cytochrome, partial [Gammaproteobacteria bacterium]